MSIAQQMPARGLSFHPQPPYKTEFYENLYRIRVNFRKVDEFVVSLEERGKGFIIKKGQTARVVCIEGPQVVDVCIWNAKNYNERFRRKRSSCNN